MERVAAHLALAAGVQRNLVIAPPERARVTLHQAPPDQIRALDQGLTGGLRQPVGETAGSSRGAPPGSASSPSRRVSSAFAAASW